MRVSVCVCVCARACVDVCFIMHVCRCATPNAWMSPSQYLSLRLHSPSLSRWFVICSGSPRKCKTNGIRDL